MGNSTLEGKIINAIGVSQKREVVLYVGHKYVYNISPILIVQKTHGRQLEDYGWIKFKGEDLDYERDIKLR